MLQPATYVPHLVNEPPGIREPPGILFWSHVFSSMNHLVYSSFQMFSPMSLNHLVYSSRCMFVPLLIEPPGILFLSDVFPYVIEPPGILFLSCFFPLSMNHLVYPSFHAPPHEPLGIFFLCFSSPLNEPPGILFFSFFFPLSLNHLVYSSFHMFFFISQWTTWYTLNPSHVSLPSILSANPISEPHCILFHFNEPLCILFHFNELCILFHFNEPLCILFHFNEPLVHFSTSMNHFVYFSLTSCPKHAFSVFMFVCQWTILWLRIFPLFTVSCQYTICPIFPFPVHLFVNHLIRSFPSSSFCVSERPYTLFSIFMFLYQ